MNVGRLRAALSYLLSTSLLLSTPVPLFAQNAPQAPVADEPTATETQQIDYDLQLLYWQNLKQQAPDIAGALEGDAFGPTWKVTNDSTLDADPFFMRGQSWSAASSGQCAEGICFAKADGKVTLQAAGHPNGWTLNQNFTPVLETAEYIFLTADDASIFEQKAGTRDNPGEGMFFINKKDILFASESKKPIPVFFFPLPGSGWSGANNSSFELGITDEVVFYDRTGFGLQVEVNDIALVEQISRKNLILAGLFSFLDGDANGQIYPKANSTMGFGTLLSGITTNTADKKADLQLRQKKIRAIANQLSPLPIASAHEGDQEPTLGNKITAQATKRAQDAADAPEGGYTWRYWKKWLGFGVRMGGMLGLAAYLYEPIDFSSMITAEMPHQIARAAQMMGGVALFSVILKYTVHKEHFQKLYPTKAGDSLLRKLNQEHKGIMSELGYGLYFSFAAIPQNMRHALAFLKSRFIPNGKLIHKLWDLTMGFQMRQNTKIPINYKTQYYGWAFGGLDSFLVGIYLLVFGPWAIKHFGLTVGAATAAMASAEMLRNVLAYFQSGGHNYSADVKTIYIIPCQAEARSQMLNDRINPDSPKNSQLLDKLTEKCLERRYKTVGLPGQNEFLYDPITVLESLTRRAGFGPSPALQQDLTEKKTEARRTDPEAEIAEPSFVLKSNEWGLIQPSLKRALKEARSSLQRSPSPLGAQTVKLLEWAAFERKATPAIVGRMWDTVASQWGWEGFTNSITESMAKAPVHAPRSETALSKMMSNLKNRVGMAAAAVKGGYHYLFSDSTKEVVAIRQGLYLMSTTGDFREMVKFMPKEWLEKAEGSEAAVALAGELFHRSFMGFHEHDKDMIQPGEVLRDQYGARVDKALDRLALKDATLNDPFVRDVRRQELMYRLQKRDADRKAFLNFGPQRLSEREQKMWEIVRAKATAAWSDEEAKDLPDSWQQLGSQYVELNGGGNESDAEAWSQTYRYRLIVAREFAQKVGIYSEDIGNSDFVPKVVMDAAAKTEEVLNERTVAHYRSKLSKQDREFFEAQIFTRAFIDSYVGLSVHEADHLKASSPEYPGRFQRIRRMLVGTPGEKFTNAVVRNVEALWRNEKSSYYGTTAGLLNRSLPILPDMFHNWYRTLRVLPYMLTFSWATNYFVWHVQVPYPLWFVMGFIAFLNPTFVELNNRLLKNNDIKPMEDLPSKLTYAWNHGFLTNPEVMAVQMYADDIMGFMDRNVTSPARDCSEYLVGKLTGRK